MANEYPPAYVLRIKILDAIAFLVGMALLAIPAVHRFYPGAYDTTIHVTLGALIVVCAAFRILVAYGSAWLEIVLLVLGVLTLNLPRFMHMSYYSHYNSVHLALGAILMATSIISGALTFSELRRLRRTA